MRRFLTRHGTGLAVGTLAGAVALEAAFLAGVMLSLPFAPFALAQGVVDITPGQVSTVFIDLLQFWAKRLLEIGVVAFHLLMAALAGALLARGASLSRTALVAAVPWALNLAAALVFATRRIDPSSVGVDGAVGLVTYLVALTLTRGAMVPATTDLARRGYLLRLGALAAVLAAGDVLLTNVATKAKEVGRKAGLALKRPPVVTAPPFAAEDAAFDATSGLSPQLTSIPDFYVVDTALFKPKIDVAGWSLRVDGAVESPFTIDYDELLSMDAVEQVETLVCISNPIGGDLISTAKWVGVRLRDLLERAKPKPGAFDLVGVSFDGYTDSIPLAKAMEPTTLVAYGMNDEVLPEAHGFPARLLIPDIYGMKNVKWLVNLQVVTADFRGYWEERGWSDVAVINTMSRIDVPLRRTVKWDGGPLRVGGIAFAGARDVAKVEVSLDGGKTWRDAKLGREVNNFTWRRWIFEWTPDGPGEATLVVRATDGRGVRQASVRREPYPDGATGYHLMPIKIERASS